VAGVSWFLVVGMGVVVCRIITDTTNLNRLWVRGG
jgi:hypothetical protein